MATTAKFFGMELELFKLFAWYQCLHALHLMIIQAKHKQWTSLSGTEYGTSAASEQNDEKCMPAENRSQCG
jgi:hypothetical protein